MVFRGYAMLIDARQIPFVLILTAVLTGCGGSTGADENTPAADVVETERVEPAAGARAENPSATQEAASQPVSISDVVADIEAEADAIELDDGNLLPDLIDGGKTERKTAVSAKVLTDEEAEQLTDSLDGVEVKLEVKTK